MGKLFNWFRDSQSRLHGLQPVEITAARSASLADASRGDGALYLEGFVKGLSVYSSTKAASPKRLTGSYFEGYLDGVSLKAKLGNSSKAYQRALSDAKMKLAAARKRRAG